MQATFNLAGSLLIRSGQFSTEAVPDVVHLKSYRENSQLSDKQESVLPGTSLAGVLRHRAERIVNTLGSNKIMIDDLFGIVDEDSKDDNAKSSRLVVHESVIHNVNELVQNRIAIDRFTGGAYHGALFDEQPIFSKDDTQVILNLELRQPSNAEIGLLLLLLKDLWTSDLPVGGESSIGRGRLEGIKTEMKRYTQDTGEETWEIKQNQKNQKLHISNARMLESFVSDFFREVRV
jgi:CRISPR/Cas system CSM-associated protein Csm3 (group 7 of RAMP superfamily)